jgi:hypothetical protein
MELDRTTKMYLSRKPTQYLEEMLELMGCEPELFGNDAEIIAFVQSELNMRRVAAKPDERWYDMSTPSER